MNPAETFELGQSPTTKEAQAIADELYAEFVSEEVDKVRLWAAREQRDGDIHSAWLVNF